MVERRQVCGSALPCPPPCPPARPTQLPLLPPLLTLNTPPTHRHMHVDVRGAAHCMCHLAAHKGVQALQRMQWQLLQLLQPDCRTGRRAAMGSQGPCRLPRQRTGGRQAGSSSLGDAAGPSGSVRSLSHWSWSPPMPSPLLRSAFWVLYPGEKGWNTPQMAPQSWLLMRACRTRR